MFTPVHSISMLNITKIGISHRRGASRSLWFFQHCHNEWAVMASGDDLRSSTLRVVDEPQAVGSHECGKSRHSAKPARFGQRRMNITAAGTFYTFALFNIFSVWVG